MLISSDFLLTHVADCKMISNIIGPDSRNASLKCRNRNTGSPWDQKFEIQKASPEGFLIRDTSGALTPYYSCLAIVRKQPNQTVQLPEPEPLEHAVRQASSNPPTTGTVTPQSPSS